MKTKYKLRTNYDSDGKLLYYTLAFKFIFWWVNASVAFATKKGAEDALKQLNGYSKLDN